MLLAQLGIAPLTLGLTLSRLVQLSAPRLIVAPIASTKVGSGFQRTRSTGTLSITECLTSSDANPLSTAQQLLEWAREVRLNAAMLKLVLAGLANFDIGRDGQVKLVKLEDV